MNLQAQPLGVRVGYFDATYPDGTPVAAVALVNEYGSDKAGVPERPFIRNATPGIQRTSRAAVLSAVRRNGAVSRQGAGRIGEMAKSRIQRSLIDLRDPVNAKSTIIRKGSSNPLVDESVMLTSVSYEVY